MHPVSLRPDWAAIVEGLVDAGAVTFRTQSGGILVEQTGTIGEFNIRGEGAMGSVVQGDLDLRLLFRNWTAGEAHPAHTTMDFHDVTCAICTSVHAADDLARGTLEQLIDRFGTDSAPAAPAAAARRPSRPDSAVDVAALRADWTAMTNVHHFEQLLGKHGVGRMQAFRLVGNEYAVALAPAALRNLLDKLDASGEEIMVFVANQGMVQIFSGPARGNRRVGHGWEIAHGQSKVYIPDTALHNIWLVNKPTLAGIISSMELCTEAEDQALASIFARHPHGDPQPEGWLDLLKSLPKA